MTTLTFWYDFASTYSYLSAMRVRALAKAAGATVVWRPFLLGPVFKAQGLTTSPFNVYPAKGRYMVRDIERLASQRTIPFRMPARFPADSLLAARLALVAEAAGCIAPFSEAVFQAGFGAGHDIADPDVMAAAWRQGGAAAAFDRAMEAAHSTEIKQRLRTQTEAAVSLGIFGAPTFVTADGELFWGDDRLAIACDWAQQF